MRLQTGQCLLSVKSTPCAFRFLRWFGPRPILIVGRKRLVNKLCGFSQPETIPGPEASCGNDGFVRARPDIRGAGSAAERPEQGTHVGHGPAAGIDAFVSNDIKVLHSLEMYGFIKVTYSLEMYGIRDNERLAIMASCPMYTGALSWELPPQSTRLGIMRFISTRLLHSRCTFWHGTARQRYVQK
jgi:hypothetical protein